MLGGGFVPETCTMLKFIVTNLDDVDEAHRDLYQSDGTGKFVLKVEGAVPKAQVQEFRDNNVQLKEKLEKFEGIDPENVAEVLATMKKVQDGELVESSKKEDVDKLVEDRVAEMKKQHDKELQDSSDRNDKLSGELANVKIKSALLKAGAEHGMRATAAEDLVARGKQVFSLDDDGNLVAKDEDGNAMYGKAGSALTPGEFIKDLSEKAEHLFDPNEGGGSSGSGGGGGQGGDNPFSKDTWNLTKQNQLINKDPKQARKLATAAGVSIKIPG